MSIHIRIAIIVCAVAVCVAERPLARQAASASYTLTPVAHGMQLKAPGGRVVLEYMTSKPADVPLTSPSVACFHPVYTPSGERVTALAPDDHPHHRGIYLAWHDAEFRQPMDRSKAGPYTPAFGWNITKADFWGWGEYAPREGRVIQTRDIKLASADARRAEIEIHNDWMVRTRKMAEETLVASVAERDGVYVLDLAYRIAPLVDYQLNKQSFSGFNFQARKDGESYFTNVAGTVNLPNPHYSVPELNWPPAPWYGYVIKLQNGKTVGAVVVDHPSNPPSTWHNSRSLWMLNPVIAALGPMTIRAGAPLTLRYRVVVHDGPTPAPIIERLSTEFRAAS